MKKKNIKDIIIHAGLFELKEEKDTKLIYKNWVDMNDYSIRKDANMATVIDFIAKHYYEAGHILGSHEKAEEIRKILEIYDD